MKQVICHAHGCQCTSLMGKHFCAKHISQEESYGKRSIPKRKKSKEWHHLYNTVAWRTRAREFLKRYPICCRCGGKATIADHIKPHRGDLVLFYDEYNLQPLCQRCHSAKTLAENNYFKKDLREGRV